MSLPKQGSGTIAHKPSDLQRCQPGSEPPAEACSPAPTAPLGPAHGLPGCPGRRPLQRSQRPHPNLLSGSWVFYWLARALVSSPT